MGVVLPTTAVNADGVEYTKAWVLNWDKVAQAGWFAIPKFMPVKIIFDARAIVPVLIMFIVTAVETVGDISGVIEGGMDREATDSELSGGVVCDGIGSTIAAFFGVLPNTSFSQNVGLSYYDKDRKPFCTCNRSNLLNPVWIISKTCCIDLYHATERIRWSSCYDVLFYRDQWYSADHKRTINNEKYYCRICSSRTWIWNRCKQHSSFWTT